MKVSVKVIPGSKRPHVGGRWGDSEPAVLIVAVRARAVDGAANDAVCVALADACAVARGAVSLVAGARSRLKIVEIDGVTPEQISTLLESG